MAWEGWLCLLEIVEGQFAGSSFSEDFSIWRLCMADTNYFFATIQVHDLGRQILK